MLALRRFAFVSLFVFLFACGEDTLGTGTQECVVGEEFNPITGACEGRRNTVNNTTPTNNGVGENNTTNNGVDPGCTDCAVAFRPGSAAFTYTPVREAGSADVEIVSQVDSDIVVSAIEFAGATPNEFILVGLDVGDTLSFQASRQVTVQFSPQDTQDDDVVLKVHFQGLPEVAELVLTSRLVGADVCTENCPRIQVSPSSVAISYQPGDPNALRTIVVGSSGDANLVVHEILLIQSGREYTIQHGALPFDMRPQTTNSLDLTFDTSAGTAPTAKLLIRSNDPWTPEVEVPIRASSKDATTDPCISVAPTTLNFGTVQRGSPVVKQFTITNCGPVELNVSDIQRGSFFLQPTSQAYQLTGWTRGAVPVGGSQVVDMTYSPRQAGLNNGNFIVRSNAANNSAVRVNVRGVADQPPLVDQDIHIKVSWDTDETDVDTHVLLLPGQGLFCGNDCYFSNPSPDWGVQGDWQDDAFLDLDDVDGFGPENVNIEKGIDGMRYRVVLHYWNDTHNESFPASTDATVELYVRGVLAQSWGPLQLGGTGDTRNVFEIAWPSQTITTLDQSIYSVPSSTSCRSTP